MTDAPLIIGAVEHAKIVALRTAAAMQPVDMLNLMKAIKTPHGERSHRAQMQAQTVVIPGPWPFFVTFSIETGHGAGTCRHMSMSIKREGRVPNMAAVWMVAEELGFIGGLNSCKIWPEQLSDGGIAINIVQPVSLQVKGTA